MSKSVARTPLVSTKTVREATEEYQIDEDVLGAWIRSSCEEGLQYAESTSRLFEHYLWWLKESGFEKFPHMPAFSKMLTERGYLKRKVGDDILRVGLRLAQEERQIAAVASN